MWSTSGAGQVLDPITVLVMGAPDLGGGPPTG